MPVYYDKKTETYYCKFYYTDYTGARKQKLKRGFRLQREAKAWEHDFLSKQSALPSMPIRELLNLYLEDKKINNKEISYQTRFNRIKNWIRPYFDAQPVDQITPANIREWQNTLKTSTGATGKPLSPAYMNNIVMELSEAFNYAVRFYGLSSNPVTVAGNTAGHKTIRRDFWTKTEFDKFISTFEKEDLYYTVFMVLYYTGVRVGELQAITAGDIHPDRITINKTYHMIKGREVITAPKTKKAVRDILIPPFLSEILTEYQSRFYGLKKSDRVFPWPDTTIGRKLKDHSKAAALPEIRIHGLRHSHASLLIELGFSALLVSERLGHENITTTLNIYSHLFPSKQSEVSDRLQGIFENSIKPVS